MPLYTRDIRDIQISLATLHSSAGALAEISIYSVRDIKIHLATLNSSAVTLAERSRDATLYTRHCGREIKILCQGYQDTSGHTPYQCRDSGRRIKRCHTPHIQLMPQSLTDQDMPQYTRHSYMPHFHQLIWQTDKEVPHSAPDNIANRSRVATL